MRCLPVIAVVLILAVAATRGQEDTTLSGAKESSEQNSTIEITEEERSEMLDKHNKYRKQHNASPLELDDEARTIDK